MADVETVVTGGPQRITTSRARILRTARPKWVMVGLEWDGPGVLLLASDRLSRAQLDFEARQYEFRSMADLQANFAPSLALTTIIETHPAQGRKDGYVLIAAPDWMQAMQALFGEWTPDPEQRALETPPSADAEHGSSERTIDASTADGEGRRVRQAVTDRHHGQG